MKARELLALLERHPDADVTFRPREAELRAPQLAIDGAELEQPFLGGDRIVLYQAEPELELDEAEPEEDQNAWLRPPSGEGWGPGG